MSHEENDVHEKFLFTLDWLLAVTRRYSSSLEFGLAHINFENPGALGDAYGAPLASHKLDDVLLLLRKAIRKTDLVARDGADFWILLPHATGEEKLADRIREIVDLTSQSGLQIVERDLTLYSFPKGLPELEGEVSAYEFLSHLKQNHSTLASRELCLLPQK